MIEPPVEFMNKIRASAIGIGKEIESAIRLAAERGFQQGYEQGYKDCMEDKEFHNGTNQPSME